MKTVLITGASGFIGAVLAHHLVKLKDYDVNVFVRSNNMWRLKDIVADIQVHNIDLCNEQEVRRAVDKIKPDYIYHFAAFGAYPFQEDPTKIIDTNIIGTWNLLKATADHDYELFVNAGSSSEYGFKSEPMKETDVLEPNSYYSVAKCSQTLLTQYFARTEKKPISTFRLFSIYGPFEEPSRLVPTVISRCLKNEPIELVSPNVARDFVYVDDVIEACLKVDYLSSMHGEILNIGSGIQSTIKDVTDIIVELTSSSSVCNYNTASPRIWDTTKWVGDCSLAKQKIDWACKTSLRDGLQKTIEWMKK